MSVQSFTDAYVSNPDKSSCGSNMMVFDGVIYSYGKHYPIAIHRDGKFYVNNTPSSKTTNRHVTSVKRSLNGNFEERSKSELLEMIGE